MKRHFGDVATRRHPNVIKVYFLYHMGEGGLDRIPCTGAILGSVNGGKAGGPEGIKVISSILWYIRSASVTGLGSLTLDSPMST